MQRLQEAQDKIHCCFLGCPGEIGGPEKKEDMKQRLAPCHGTQQRTSSRPDRTPPPKHSALPPSTCTTSTLQTWSSPSPLAHYNGTLQWHSNVTTSTPPKLALPHHSTLQWHPAMAPSNGTTSTPPNLVVTLHGTLQWHPAMSPRPLPRSWPSPTIAHYNGTLQPSNGTTSTPPNLVVTLPNHSTLQWHPTMAPSNGTTSTAPCNGTWGHVQSANRRLPLYWKQEPL